MRNSLHDCLKNSSIYTGIYMWRRERAEAPPAGVRCIYVAMWDGMRGGGREGEREREREREREKFGETEVGPPERDKTDARMSE